MLYMDASKYVYACVLTQHSEGTDHPITYVSSLFRGSQLDWATLTKEAYAIYMSVKKLSFYINTAKIIVKSDHLPLKKFLEKNTMNLDTSTPSSSSASPTSLLIVLIAVIIITPSGPPPWTEGHLPRVHLKTGVFETLLPNMTLMQPSWL